MEKEKDIALEVTRVSRAPRPRGKTQPAPASAPEPEAGRVVGAEPAWASEETRLVRGPRRSVPVKALEGMDAARGLASSAPVKVPEGTVAARNSTRSQSLKSRAEGQAQQGVARSGSAPGDACTQAERRSVRSAPARAPPGAEALLETARPVPPMPQPLERYALVAWVLGRERAAELLGGLGTREAERAKEHLLRIAALPSAQRQAKVAVEFGQRADATARLKALMAEASEPLRREIFRRLPPYQRTLFSGRRVEPADAEAPPALGALAERLIREATR